jgi:ferric-dicitrate binding protein FerR (iron transport regulator)
VKKDVDYIYLLMTAKVAGVISAEEDAWLDQLISEDTTVKTRWEQFRQEHSHEQVAKTFRQYEQDWINASDITAIPQKQPPTYKKYRSAVIISLALIGICLGIYLFSAKSKPAEMAMAPKTMKATDAKQIVLQLAGGNTVRLSAATDSINIAGTQLASSNKTLSYTAGSGAATNAFNTLTVPTGLDYHVNLSDGSEIWLNSATQLKFPFAFNGPTREIAINGEAYIKAAPNASKPFLVHTPRGTVQVLGTEFNVNSYDSGIVKVALVTGAVRFAAAGKEVMVKPGTEAIYAENKGIRLQAFDEEEVLAWRTGNYPFSDATLSDITAILPRWFGVTISIDNPSLNKERFTGVMSRNKPIRVFLDHLKATTNINYEFDQEGTLHFK